VPASSISILSLPPSKQIVRVVLERRHAYGTVGVGGGRKVQVEFVFLANPTGPLHVGHGRGAAYGASLASLLEAAGFCRHARVLRQRRPAGRWTSWCCRPGCAIWRSPERGLGVSGECLPGRLRARPWRGRFSRRMANVTSIPSIY